MGLPSGSRLKFIAAGIDPANIPPGQILLAALCDLTKQIPYALTDTTYNGTTFLGDIMGVETPKPRKQGKHEPESSVIKFESPADFNAARAKIMK